MYLTYYDYLKWGGEPGEAEFERQRAAAERRVRAKTHGRLDALGEIPEEARRCVFDLIAKQRALEANGGRAVVAEANDGISVTYRDDGRGGEQELDDCVRFWLEGVSARGVRVLYAGVEA